MHLCCWFTAAAVATSTLSLTTTHTHTHTHTLTRSPQIPMLNPPPPRATHLDGDAVCAAGQPHDAHAGPPVDRQLIPGAACVPASFISPVRGRAVSYETRESWRLLSAPSPCSDHPCVHPCAHSTTDRGPWLLLPVQVPSASMSIFNTLSIILLIWWVRGWRLGVPALNSLTRSCLGGSRAGVHPLPCSCCAKVDERPTAHLSQRQGLKSPSAPIFTLSTLPLLLGYTTPTLSQHSCAPSASK